MMDKAEEILKVKDVKSTAVRLVVLRYLINESRAQSLKSIEKNLPLTERSTIFRTLKTFEEKKVVHTVEDGSGMVKYALCAEGCNCGPEDLHFHFYCTKCEQTHCLIDYPVPNIKLPNNFKMHQANMVVKGLCDKCS